MSKTQLFVANVNTIIDAGDVSVSEIARRAGINRPELSRLLNGLGGVSIERAEKIAEAVGVSLDELLAAPIEVGAVA